MPNDKPVSYSKAMKMAESRGIADPEVKCIIHNITLKHSELSNFALMCLEEGLDVVEEYECLLLMKD